MLNMHRRSDTTGFALIEQLVALLILTSGLIGATQLTVSSLREVRHSLSRTLALQLISDMSERIRANAIAGLAYDSGPYAGAARLWDCASRLGQPGRNCSPTELAEDDLAEWQAEVRRQLPAPPGVIEMTQVTYIGGNPHCFRLRLLWQESIGLPPAQHETQLCLAQPL
jgi:type IV pilus assembly protein PilV